MNTSSHTPRARRTYFLDSENHINTCLQGIEALNEDDLVLVFHRESNLSQRQKAQIQDSPAQIEWILCQDSGVKNSLDVQLIAELSRRIACHEIENGYIISQDQGYKPAIHYLFNRYGDDFRFVGLKRSIDEFMLTDALISAESRQDVHDALARTSGQVLGAAMYRHIRDLFDATPSDEEPEEGFPPLDVPDFPSNDSADTRTGTGAGRSANSTTGAGGNNAPRKSNKRRKPRSASRVVEIEASELPVEENQAEKLHHDIGSGSNVEETKAVVETKKAQDDEQPVLRPGMATRRARRKPVSEPAQPKQDNAVAAEEIAPEPAPSVNVTAQETAKPKKRPAKSKAVKTETPDPKVEKTAEAPVEQVEAKPVKKPAKDKQQNLTSLPGIGIALAKRLEAAGVPTPSALKEIGSRDAWMLLKKSDHAASVSWLYALEGAIQGISIKELDADTKAELKTFSVNAS